MIGTALQHILNWSEVWALVIPLTVLYFHPKQPAILKPVIVYLWLALIINTFGDIIADYKRVWHFPHWLQSNNPLYNIHSVIRFCCFSWFFITRKEAYFTIAKKTIPVAFAILFIINFSFLETFFYYNSFSDHLLSAEAFLLLIYCLLYYLGQLKADTESFTGTPDFWIVTGLSIFVVINFFVFLFYKPMYEQNEQLAADIWNVHNVAYIIFSFFIAQAFYVSYIRKY